MNNEELESIEVQGIIENEDDFLEVSDDDAELSMRSQLLSSENKMLDIIFDAEKKHGPHVHMVLEVVFKSDDPNNDDQCYWVEFENQSMYFETLEEVEKFLLEDAVVTGEGPKVIYAQSHMT